MVSLAQTNTFRARLHLGQAAEWLARFDQAEQDRELSGLTAAQSAQRTLALAHLGRFAEAEDMAPGYLDGRLQAKNEIPVGQLIHFLEVAVLVGAKDLASMLASRVALIESPTAAYTCPARHLGAAAALLGNPEEARAYYQQALELCAKFRFRPEIAATRLQLAELLLEHYPDERAEALEHLEFAIGEFREMKMQPSLERALGHRRLLKA